MAESKHDKVAKRIAKQRGAEYNRGPGADIQTPDLAIEVEAPNTIGDAQRQLRGYKKRVYIAPTNANGVKKALKHYKGTTIGVMRPSGKIAKPSTRGRKK